MLKCHLDFVYIIERLDKHTSGTAGGIVDRFVLAGLFVDAEDFGEDARHFRGGVKLALALAGFGGEVAHEVFIGIAQQVVMLCAVFAELHVFEDTD